MKRQTLYSVVRLILYIALMVALGLRVIRDFELEGISLFIFLCITILTLYTSISFALKIYKEYKQSK